MEKISSIFTKQFWKEHTFWTDGYFACSVGNVSEEMLKRYIENQG
ncbi:MAG: transposase [Lachnospiraceae bacterium]